MGIPAKPGDIKMAHFLTHM